MGGRRQLAPGSCEVWWAVPDPALFGADGLVDDVERGRWQGLLRAADRTRFATGAILLRRLVAAHTGVPPAEVVVDRRCPGCGRPHGRPRLPQADLHVSVSHSGDRVAVALARVGPVGVDVELIGDADVHGLGPQVLAPEETIRDARDFYTYWTRKESAVKATGDGLSAPLSQVRVSPPGDPAALLGYPGGPLAAWMTDLRPGAGYVGAVTVLAAGPVEVTEHHATGAYPPG